MRMVLHRPQDLLAPDAAELRAIHAARALLGAVLHAEFDRIDPEPSSDFVDDLLRGKGGLGRARSTVRGAAGLVDHNVVAIDRDVSAVVGGEDAHPARCHIGAGIGAGLVRQAGLERLQLTVGARPDLDAHVRARGRARADEDVFARHDHLDRPTGLPGEQGRDRL